MKFSKWIEKSGYMHKHLIELLDISRPTFERILKGEDIRMSLAFSVEKLTNGEVSVIDLYNAYKEQSRRSANEQKTKKNNGRTKNKNPKNLRK